jgi:hypothetical protein
MRRASALMADGVLQPRAPSIERLRVGALWARRQVFVAGVVDDGRETTKANHRPSGPSIFHFCFFPLIQRLRRPAMDETVAPISRSAVVRASSPALFRSDQVCFLLARVLITAGILFAPASIAHAAVTPDATNVLKASRERVQTADFRATGHLVRVDADGKRTSSGISVKGRWFPGVLRVVLDVAPPSNAKPDTRVHILLEMRPNGQDSIQIAHPGDKSPVPLPFDKWTDGPLGPGYSYEDFLEAQYFWPEQTVVDQTKFGSRDCDVLKSSPGATDRTQYAEIKTWLDRSIGFPVYLEKTLRGTGAVKEFTYFGLRHNGGVWSASQIESKIRGRAGSTLLIIDRGSAKANLGLGDFSPEQLTHF